MSTPQHPTPTTYLGFDGPTIGAAALVGTAVLVLFPQLLYFALPVVAGGVTYGSWRAWQHYHRTHGASQLAYRDALAHNKDTPPPPKNFKWADHAIYRSKLKEVPTVVEPLAIPERLRREHQLIVAGTGHGKTQLIEWQVLQDLNSPNPPALLIIDSKSPSPKYQDSNLIERISRLAVFHPETGRLRDRLVIVDPTDKPALNPFHTDDTSEDNIANMSNQLLYFLGALQEMAATKNMEALLRPIAYMLIAREGSRLKDLPEAMDDIAQYSDTIRDLPDYVQNILNHDLKSFDRNARAGIRRRIASLIMQAPQFGAMFNAATNAVDLTKAFNERKIVLVSTDVKKLGKDGSAAFGKFFIARAIDAARRATRKPNYIIIDEALPYTDDNIEEIIATLRSYETGVVLAYQTFERVPTDLQPVIRTNTTLRFIGGGYLPIAKFFAPDFKVDADFIEAQDVDRHTPPQFTRFAFNIKGRSTRSFQIPIGALDKEQRMSDGDYAKLREKNRTALEDRDPTPEASVRHGGSDFDEDE